jgi:anti-anti-sigma regulatory factor
MDLRRADRRDRLHRVRRHRHAGTAGLIVRGIRRDDPAQVRGCAAIAHNLTRAAGHLAGPGYAAARPASIRVRLITVAARRIHLHLPERWPWQAAFDNQFAVPEAPFRPLGTDVEPAARSCQRPPAAAWPRVSSRILIAVRAEARHLIRLCFEGSSMGLVGAVSALEVSGRAEGSAMMTAADLQLGDHVCLPFDTDEQAQTHILAFTRAGLAGRQQVMVFTQTVAAGDMVAWLRQQDRAFAAALNTGQLQVHRPDDVHLAGGHFDPQRMTATFSQVTAQAQSDGYRGLRVTVDMSWALRPVSGTEQLFDFEATANQLFVEGRLAAVCAYDRRRFEPAAIRRACAAHPITPGGSVLRFSRLQTPGLRLHGEVDFTNRHAVAGLLASLPDADATLDITGLTFIDASAMGLLGRAAAARRYRTTLRCSPVTARLLRLLSVDQVAAINAGE